MVVNMVKICGIDEAGRGCVAGSLFVCGVACESLSHIADLNDSKKLTRKKRDEIYRVAIEAHIPHFVVKVGSEEIDSKGISACMKEALSQIMQNLPAESYIFDGNTSFGVSGIECVIKGDSKIPQISLASIIAKSLKDKESDELYKLYPQFRFDKHKGYGTKEHIDEIIKSGFSPIHRKSFRIKGLEKLYENLLW